MIGRKTIFPDGRKRLAFGQSVIDKFTEEHPEMVQRARRFSRVTETDKKNIIRRITKLAADSGLSRHKIIDQVASEEGKAHETVRQILKEYEQKHPAKAIFSGRPEPISAGEAAELYRLFKQGTPVKELTQRFEITRSSVYRLVNVRRARTVLGAKIEFIYSEEFDQS